MASRGARFSSRQRIWIATLWSAFGIFDATQTVALMQSEGMHHRWIALFVARLVAWLPWALATPSVLHLGRRYRPSKTAPATTWVIHVSYATAIGLSYSVWTSGLETLLDPYDTSRDPTGFMQLVPDKFLGGILTSLVLYGVVLVVQYALETRGRLDAQQLESFRLNEQLLQAQASALRRQLEPHFLFNALHAISGLVREERAEAAVDMIASLSDFLRRTLDDSTRLEVPLREEMDLVERYLEIQKVRFADRLRVDIDLPVDLDRAAVPNLILQPLVENAVKHGIAKRARGGSIGITASRGSELLELRIWNDGPKLPRYHEEAVMGRGIGIENVRRRLEQRYGDGFAFRIQDRPSGGVEVMLRLPFRDAPALP